MGERETLLGTWVPFRLGPSSLRKPLKAANDPLPVPGWEAVSGYVNTKHALRFEVKARSLKRILISESPSMKTIRVCL